MKHYTITIRNTFGSTRVVSVKAHSVCEAVATVATEPQEVICSCCEI